jgi:hypothetical protein
MVLLLGKRIAHNFPLKERQAAAQRACIRIPKDDKVVTLHGLRPLPAENAVRAMAWRATFQQRRDLWPRLSTVPTWNNITQGTLCENPL